VIDREGVYSIYTVFYLSDEAIRRKR